MAAPLVLRTATAKFVPLSRGDCGTSLYAAFALINGADGSVNPSALVGQDRIM
jgi:hypothetical protein